MLKGKHIAIFNIANKRSIAWSIAKAMDAQGAELILGYQNERTKATVEGLAQELHRAPAAILPCDVTFPEQIEKARETIAAKVGTIDGLVHSLAFAPREALQNDYVMTEREHFLTALEISAYSLVALARELKPVFSASASIITLTYYGSEKVMPSYNVMGVAKAALEASVRYLAEDLGRQNIRVNGLSAGPMRTLAASGIGDFRYILRWNQLNAPLRRNVTLEDVGGAALYLLSELSAGVTGEIHHVDCGYHVVGMMAPDGAAGIRDLLEGYS